MDLLTALCAALGCLPRPESRAVAPRGEGLAVSQCRYFGGVHGAEPHRMDEHGTPRHAETGRGNTDWDPVLTDRSVLGASTA
jgi:hypothetical protein